MIDFLSLVKDTGAYKIVKGDKDAKRISHAYLLIAPDQRFLTDYLKTFAKLILCKDGDPCNNCRTCKLIDDGVFSDLMVFPKKDQAVSTEEVNLIIEETFMRPIESDKKVFIISNAQLMNAVAQNKLLKTLEEPPKNVHILIGATSEHPLLPTIKSRVKKLEMPNFTVDKLYSVLSKECIDKERLLTALSCGDGSVGTALSLYDDPTLNLAFDLVEDVLVNMKSSKDVLSFSLKITESKADILSFISSLEIALKDILSSLNGRDDLVTNKPLFEKIKHASGFNLGATLYVLDKINQAYRRKKANANAQMLLEWLLFQILEGKFKWQKL